MKEWQRQERRMARRRRGTRNAGSGSGWKRRNDVREPGILWEMKYTGKTQITLKLLDWEQVRRHAMLEGRMPAMHLQIGKRRLVVISEDDFEEGFPANE